MNTDKLHSEEEWKALAPTLASISRESGFKVPEGFFGELQREIHLKTLGDGEQLAVPDDFFSELQHNILEKTVGSESTPVRKIRPRFWMGAVAAAAVVVLAWIFVPEQKQKCVTFACLLEQTDLSADDLANFSAEDLGDVLLNEQTSADDVEETDEYMEYLINTGFEYEDLYEYDDY